MSSASLKSLNNQVKKIDTGSRKKINLKLQAISNNNIIIRNKESMLQNINLDNNIRQTNGLTNVNMNILIKEENINDNDSDFRINKIDNYQINNQNDNDNDKTNKKNCNQNIDTLHSYSILDSKDSITPINNRNICLNLVNKKYFNNV